MIFKKIINIIFLFVVFTITFATGFYMLSPQFGKNPSKNQKIHYRTFSNYNVDGFNNSQYYQSITGKMTFSEFFKSDTTRRPKSDLEHDRIDFETFVKAAEGEIKISWLGHSAFILNINGAIVLLDPMLGEYASPIPISSMKRYSKNIGLFTEEIDSIDVVVYSHDHYDHLDYPTVQEIKDKVKTFIVPYGLANHLTRWGVNENRISELNWEESKLINGIEFVCLEALHFSGRGIGNRNSTLWSSWAIKSDYGKIYFSGDSGYGRHLKKIGEVHGPFDLSLVDCGQYNTAWKYSHMFPEDAVQASKDLRSKYFMPIHWGGFTLSTHPWTEPVSEAIKYAKIKDQLYVTPRLGQVIYLDSIVDINQEYWWRN